MNLAWRQEHARRNHTPAQHLALQRSSLLMTPEAAHKLAAFGIIPIEQMLSHKPTEDALLEAPSVPQQEVQG